MLPPASMGSCSSFVLTSLYFISSSPSCSHPHHLASLCQSAYKVKVREEMEVLFNSAPPQLDSGANHSPHGMCASGTGRDSPNRSPILTLAPATVKTHPPSPPAPAPAPPPPSPHGRSAGAPQAPVFSPSPPSMPETQAGGVALSHHVILGAPMPLSGR